MFKIVDLFCGTGALSYGLKAFDECFTVVGGIDMDSAACATAIANHPGGTFICTPIEKLSPRRFQDLVGAGNVDIIVGGPPCQGFSSLRPNRRSNTNDPRNGLYKHFFDYVRYFQPSVVLMENVIGLLDASSGELLGDILLKFRNAGYEAEWRVMNAANFGIPQKRERLIFVGVRRSGRRRPRIKYPEPTHRFSGRVIGTRFKEQYIMNAHDGVPAVTVMEAISDLPAIRSGETARYYATRPKNEYQRDRRTGAGEELSLHSAADHSAAMLRVMKLARGSRSDLPKGLVHGGFSSCYSRMEADAPATTITVKFTSPASSKCIHPTQHRAITPREAARLQGFDDTFVFRGSKTEIASQIGNAVPPLLGKVIAPMLVEHL